MATRVTKKFAGQVYDLLEIKKTKKMANDYVRRLKNLGFIRNARITKGKRNYYVWGR